MRPPGWLLLAAVISAASANHFQTQDVNSYAVIQPGNTQSHLLDFDTTLNSNTERVKGVKSLNVFSEEYIKIIVMKLQTAVTLQDNIVHLLGILIYHSQPSLNVTNYDALYDLYNAFRLKKIWTYQLIDNLETFQFKDLHTQFLMLFIKLGFLVPDNLFHSARVWHDALQNFEINVNDLLIPVNSTAKSGLLQGISEEDIKTLNKHMVDHQFKQPLSFQNEINNILQLMKRGTVQITYSLFFSVLINLQLEKFIPEVDEAIKYLYNHFKKDFQTIDLTDIDLSFNSPYRFVHDVLEHIARSSVWDRFISETINVVSKYIKPQSVLTCNPNHALMSQIINKCEINYPILFNSIVPGEYPDDIIQTKHLILMEMQKQEFNCSDLLNKFNPYYFTSQQDLLIGVIDRLRRTNWTRESVYKALNALNSHIKLKYAMNANEPREINQWEDIVFLFSSFESPYIGNHITNISQDLLGSLSKENINWPQILQVLKEYKSTNPRLLVLQVLKIVADTYSFSDSNLEEKLDRFISYFDKYGNVKELPQILIESIKQGITDMHENNFNRDHYSNSPSTSEDLKNNKEKRFIQSILAVSNKNNFSDIELKQIDELLSTPTIHELINNNPEINWIAAETDILRQILTLFSSSVEMQTNRPLHNFVERLLTLLKPQQNEIHQAVRVLHAVNTNAVLTALDIGKMIKDGHGINVLKLFEFLSGATHFNISTIHVTDLLSKNKAEFLLHFFERILTEYQVPTDTKETIEIAKHYIIENGEGMKPIEIIEKHVNK